MKVAYLIAAHDNYAHLKRLIAALTDQTARIYLHIDKKFPLPDIHAANIIFVEERVNVHWSGFSQVQATLNLLKRAMIDDNDYFILISGVDYPIRPKSALYEKLSEGGEYINLNKGCDDYNPLSRYKYYYFTDYYNRRERNSLKTRFFIWLQKGLRYLRLNKTIPFPLYTGASWFALSRTCVQYILAEVRTNRRYVRFFKTAFCPDECFFQTIIGNSGFKSNIHDNFTYADWNTDPGPAIISASHLPVLEKMDNKFFARKFKDNSGMLTETIDQTLLR